MRYDYFIWIPFSRQAIRNSIYLASARCPISISLALSSTTWIHLQKNARRKSGALVSLGHLGVSFFMRCDSYGFGRLSDIAHPSNS
jgi:hypothetical protein